MSLFRNGSLNNENGVSTIYEDAKKEVDLIERHDVIILCRRCYTIIFRLKLLVIAQLVERWTVVSNVIYPSVTGSIPVREIFLSLLYSRAFRFIALFSLLRCKRPTYGN